MVAATYGFVSAFGQNIALIPTLTTGIHYTIHTVQVVNQISEATFSERQNVTLPVYCNMRSFSMIKPVLFQALIHPIVDSELVFINSLWSNAVMIFICSKKN